ncbi:hypothetical protein HPL003_26715 [Paenibacillus terrae HPL-003]|uniref:Lipoprotein n=1 Tax=Paenibacillus terrae (strain HPL-003) TaxID=985665 RepID=G7VRN6_PAETH|nr:hypothetical protein [Paenibacillus terrae]AET62055.1 hypothetical protein HPL003_26715 [Paenibacillus terrae HPL-003]
MSRSTVSVYVACTALLLAATVGCTSNTVGEHADAAPLSGTSAGKPTQNVAKTQQTWQSQEEWVLSFYKDQSLDDEAKVHHIVDHVADMNWGTLNKISGHQSLEVIEYLYKQRAFIPSESFPHLIRASDSLDGTLGESYAAIMGELFTRDKTAMTEALANTDKSNRARGIGSIAYALSYRETSAVKKEIRQWQAGQQLTAAEKEVIRALFVKLDDPY